MSTTPETPVTDDATTAPKPATKKAPARKPAATKSTPKKSTAKKSTAKKSTAKKSTGTARARAAKKSTTTTSAKAGKAAPAKATKAAKAAPAGAAALVERLRVDIREALAKVEARTHELPKLELPAFEAPKVDLPKVDIAKARKQVAGRLADVQDDVVALPGKATEAVTDLRERASVRSHELRSTAVHGFELIREAVGR
jgi:hypothetical protein